MAKTVALQYPIGADSEQTLLIYDEDEAQYYLIQPAEDEEEDDDEEDDDDDLPLTEGEAIRWLVSSLHLDPNREIAYTGSRRTIVEWVPPGSLMARVVAQVEEVIEEDLGEDSFGENLERRAINQILGEAGIAALPEDLFGPELP